MSISKVNSTFVLLVAPVAALAAFAALNSFAIPVSAQVNEPNGNNNDNNNDNNNNHHDHGGGGLGGVVFGGNCPPLC